MAKFKMKFKVTGLELEIEGDRADIPLMTQNLGTQFAGMLEPAANIVEGESPSPKSVTNDAKPAAQIEDKPGGGRARRKNFSGGASGAPKTVITLTPDHDRWGTPSQDWTGVDKSVWLLHVLAESGHKGGATANELSQLFNEHFLQAGRLSRQNADRVLRDVSTGSDALVNRSNAGKFVLVQKGSTRALALVQQVKPKAGV